MSKYRNIQLCYAYPTSNIALLIHYICWLKRNGTYPYSSYRPVTKYINWSRAYQKKTDVLCVEWRWLRVRSRSPTESAQNHPWSQLFHETFTDKILWNDPVWQLIESRVKSLLHIERHRRWGTTHWHRAIWKSRAQCHLQSDSRGPSTNKNE